MSLDQTETRTGGVDIRDADLHVHGSIVGRDQNIFAVQFAYLPRSTRVAILGGSVAAAATLIVLIAIQASTLVSTALRASEPMTGEFNIAVAEFGQLNERGDIEPSSEGAILSKTISAGIAKEMSAFPDVNAQVRHEGVPLVRERDPRARDLALRGLASKVNADLIIFGQLAGAGPSRTVQPEFYVRGGTRGAEEILGASHLGTPVAMPENLSRSLPSQMLRSRIEALTQFTLGLERLIQRDSPAAVNWFQRAVTTPGWRNNEGKEVAYLLLGTALRARNQPGDLDLALQAYWTSADLNPQYARAHIGLGNVYYDQFARSNSQRRDLLDLALEEYQKAEAATDATGSGLLQAKVHLTKGNAYLVKAQVGEREAFALASAEFQWLLDTAASGNSDVAQFEPRAYFGLGVVYERGYHDPRQAASYYERCIAAAGTSDDEISALARTQLDIVAAQQGY